MSELLYLLSICLPLVTILLVFAMRYFSAVAQAKARLDLGDAYRQVAEKAAAAQSEHSATLASIQSSVADMRTRLTGIETILKQVE